jgi:recombination protein RecA
MAIDKKKLSTIKDMVSASQKEMGKDVASYGGKLIEASRIPTGLFPFDLATGGGFPRGKVTIIYGPESSNKTNMALLAVANHQHLYPDKTCIFIDVERSFNPDWAAALGVDIDKLVVAVPSFAEQVVDMVESFLYAEDCGIVIIDSLAAMVTTSEANSSADKAVVGGAGLVIGKLVRKTTLALGEAEKAGRQPTLIYINQTRYKIGVMFGDPETMPGGNAPRFQAALWVRVYGKNVTDSKISKIMPIAKDVTFSIKKHKVPILAASGKYTMVTVPHKDYRIGDTEDFNTISSYLKSFGMFHKGEKDKGWVILGQKYDTIQAFEDMLYKDRWFGNEVRSSIIDKLLSDNTLMLGGDEE